jgi:hypothetical protein
MRPAVKTSARGVPNAKPYGVLTLSDAPFKVTWAKRGTEHASIDYNSPSEGRRDKK